MIFSRVLLAGCFLVAAAAPVLAAEHGRCLPPEERRAKIAAHAVIPLAKAIREAKVPHREVVRAGLCEQNGRLVYVLTVLGHDGRVTRIAIDGGTGTVAASH